MLRNAILLLVFSCALLAGSSFAAAAELEIETVNESQTAFNLGGSRNQCRDSRPRAERQERHAARMGDLFG
jgi:hypothetical protein